MTIARGKPSNPFSTHCIDPKNVPYVFPPGTSMEALLDRLDADGWNLELCGNHGNGKTTLLHNLRRAAMCRDMRILHWRCCCHMRALPAGWLGELLARPDAVFLDSAERLGAARHWILSAICALLHIGLVTTTHKPIRKRFVYRVAATPETFAEVAASRVPECAAEEVRARAAAFLAEEGFDARKALFRLYDWHEAAT